MCVPHPFYEKRMMFSNLNDDDDDDDFNHLCSVRWFLFLFVWISFFFEIYIENQ